MAEVFFPGKCATKNDTGNHPLNPFTPFKRSWEPSPPNPYKPLTLNPNLRRGSWRPAAKKDLQQHPPFHWRLLLVVAKEDLGFGFRGLGGACRLGVTNLCRVKGLVGLQVQKFGAAAGATDSPHSDDQFLNSTEATFSGGRWHQ